MFKASKYLLCAVVTFATLTAQAQVQEKTLEYVIADVNPSVVSIVADKNDSQALGAGVIIGADGYIVTNAHVIENADKITALTVEDEIYEADVIGFDVKTDIALLKAKQPKDFDPALFADSDAVRVGNRVFAIGNPYGLGNSVSAGIISAKERDIDKGPYDNFLQTDASINQGNSGGPLFNMDGEIVGINTAIFSTDGSNTGVGFATPSNQVQWIVSQLKAHGKVVRGWLGIGVQKMRSSDPIQKNKLIIASMTEDSPAAKAGLKVGDILEQVGDLSLKNPRIFSMQTSQKSINTKLPVKVLRDNELVETEVVVSVMPTAAEEKTSETKDEMSDDIQIDLEKKALDAEKLKKAVEFPELNFSAFYDEENGYFIVTDVKNDSDASRKGIVIGDKFNMANGKKIFGVEDFKIKIKQAQEIKRLELQVICADTVDIITLNLD
ncbi:MAG: trypsin-like peptidase domain-containing protein [Alphaproteobacteria bacterium]|nr:trypsin-like peptidase domain-containing protein [Alphaproteobacteria bacterium]